MNEVLATPKNLAEWKESGLQLIKALRVRGEEEAFRRLLSDLYPDTAHFIFELLQNAEDTKATSVNFILNAEQLEFMHNGDRLFSESDVKAITSFGNSTKRDDETSIGKFGVGFKAVFAYTDTPEIHSGNFHFQIYDLVVPEFDHVPQLPFEGNKTNFIFPFNNPKKPASLAVSEIEKGLCALGDNTLLFLSHIRKISYSLPDGSQGSLERIDHENGRIEIKTKPPHQEESISNWLHFYKDVIVINTDDGKEQIFRVAIAYQLEQIIDKNKTETWKIVPVSKWQVSKGQVSIYFPAEKEKSGLRFHIHAPFASTVARDVVRSCDENDKLLDHIADLIVESLELIKSQGLLTLEFLAVLPNNTDELGDFYKPIREKIIHQFKYSLLTPTKYGDYSSAFFLYQSSPTFSNLISNTDLKLLINDEYAEHADWVANARQRNSREDKFLDSLQIDKFEFDNLFEIFESLDTAIGILDEDEDTKDGYEEEINSYNEIKAWFEQKDDKWIKQFYNLLSEDEDNLWYQLNFPLVRINSVDAIKHVRGNEAYFEPSIQENFENSENILIVKREVYTKDKANNNIDENAVSFLKSIGVREFDERASIQIKLNQYDNKKNEHTNSYLMDIRSFVSYWKRTSDIDIFENHVFLKGKSKEGNIKWLLAHEIFLDAPYTDTGLKSFFNDSSIGLKKYKCELLNEYKHIKNFTDFAVALGVMSHIEIRTDEATKLQKDVFNKSGRITSTTVDEDYYLNGISWYKGNSKYYVGTFSLDSKNFSISNLIWKTACKAKEKQLTAHYLPNQSSHNLEKKALSSFIKKLKESAWVPDINGHFFKPCDLNRDTLHPDFIYDNENGWLTAVEFGTGQIIRNAVELNKEKIAKSEGFSSHEKKAKWAALDKLGFDPEKIHPKQQKIKLPEDSVHNIERRTKGILERSENAPSKESIKRERSIQIGIQSYKAEAKAYLRAKYTNAQGELGCQCCHQEMPFKINGEYYFEAVQCIKELKKHHPQNNLAFCPNCAAMYQYACEIDQSDIIRLIIDEEFDGDKNSFEIVIKLAGEHHTIRFVPTHFTDLQVLFKLILKIIFL